MRISRTTSPSPRPSRRLGPDAERRVRRHFRLRGYRILAANARAGRYEVDLVARRGRVLVVCEVKARSGTGLRRPAGGGRPREGAPGRAGRARMARSASGARRARAPLRGGRRSRSPRRARVDALNRLETGTECAPRVRICLVASVTCSRARSPMRSSVSRPGPSRSRPTSSEACRRSRSSGCPDKACQEAKERVRSGIASAELEWPLRRITVNLAPAGLRKEGSGYDLPIALAVLAASRQIPPERLAGHAAVGELALDGRLRPVPGAIVAAEAARRAGLDYSALPGRVRARSRPRRRCEPVPLRHLAEAGAYLRGAFGRHPSSRRRVQTNGSGPDLADVRGQERARRALEIVAAGRHNLLLAGPPGTGKTMLARRLPGILPLLTREEALEVTRIHSVAGVLPASQPLVDRPPFRAPHHTASAAAVVGRRPRAAARRSEPLPPRCPAPRRAARVPPAGARGTPPAARGRRRRSRAGHGPGGLSGALRARGNHEPLSVRGSRRSGDRVHLHPAAARRVRSEALAGAPRPLRPGRLDAPSARRELDGGPGESSSARARARRRGRRPSPGAATPPGRRGAWSCSRAPWTRCRCRPAGGRASPGSRRPSRRSPARTTIGPAHVAEALSYRSPRELAP